MLRSVAPRLFVILQHLLPQHLLSRLVHRLAHTPSRPLKNALVRAFLRAFHPDMSEAAESDPFAYPTFNAFFTRALRTGARPVSTDPALLVSPVDGTISQLGRIEGATLLQAKGRNYTLQSLLREHPQWTAPFTGGAFATLYLAPFNYHRIHMPRAGTLRAAWYIPGRLYSVNAVTAAAVPNLFAINERVVCVFEDGTLVFALVLVGALFVGSISTVWHGDVTPTASRRVVELPVSGVRAPLRLEHGAELGRFNMGSTVILLLPPAATEWLPQQRPGATVRVGEPLGRLLRRADGRPPS